MATKFFRLTSSFSYTLAATLFAFLAFTPNFASAALTPQNAGLQSVYGAIGFSEGGFALGVDYEYLGYTTHGVGGYVRMYQKDSSAPHTADGIVTFGAFVRPHFNKKEWDFYISPGFGIVSIDAVSTKPGNSTTLGPSLGLGLVYELSTSVALGIENMRTWVWFDNDWRGLRVDDLMLKFRLTF